MKAPPHRPQFTTGSFSLQVQVQTPSTPRTLTTALLKKDHELRQYKALAKHLQATLDIAAAQVCDLTSKHAELSQKYTDILHKAQSSSKEASKLKRTLGDVLPTLREYKKMAHLRNAVTVKHWLEKRLTRETAVKERTEAENAELREENSLLSEMVDELLYADGAKGSVCYSQEDSGIKDRVTPEWGTRLI